MARQLQVTVDKSACVHYGACIKMVPTVFGTDADGKSEVIDPTGSSAPEAEIIQAALNCPMSAIAVSDEHGNDLLA